MKIQFNTYADFLKEYQNYHFDKCNNCTGICEVLETEVLCLIEGITLHFPMMFVLRCTKCGNEFLPEHTKQMIDGAYKTAIKENQTRGEFRPKRYKKKFKYCVSQNYDYDHRDYYNIPGLSYDEEHSVEGFLTPVYFDKKALIYFLAIPEYEVSIFSETYGYFAKKDPTGVYSYEWHIPFGFNSQNKLVLWLGDLEGMDDQSKAILKGFNVESDHLLIESEFYQAQMNCIFSEPIIEQRILNNKNYFIKNIKNKYLIDLSHLTEECALHERDVQRPVIFTEQSVSGVINAYDKTLVEGINISQLRTLYELLYVDFERNNEYKRWQSIKLIEAVLVKFGGNILNCDIAKLMSPLYILHDYRIYLTIFFQWIKKKKQKDIYLIL